MSFNYLAIGSIVAAILIFAWGAVSHAVLPWHEATMQPFAEDNAVVETVRSQANGNGVYYSKKGLLVSVFFPPDFGDVGKDIGRNLAIQAGIDLATGVLLALLVGLLASRSVLVATLAAGAAGLAAALAVHVSGWNWYQLPLPYIAVLSADIVIGWLLAGAALGVIRAKTAD